MSPAPQEGLDVDEVVPREVQEGDLLAFGALIELNRRRAKPGGSVLDSSGTVESLWGTGNQCLWSRGEPLLIAGGDGVGKTSLAEQLALALIGVKPPKFLGFDVQPVAHVLYAACDRPAQAVRSMRRMVTESDRERLNRGLVVWEGPLPFDLAREPGALLALARHLGCDAVILDSIKDVAADLRSDETGLGLSRAFQLCVADGIDVAALHHQRKQQNGAGKPNKLSDVYGSRWFTAACGSVLMLWGEAGDHVVELTHLKQPSEAVGPLMLVHDHVHGHTTVFDRVDALTLVQGAQNGITPAEIAERLYGDAGVNNVRKARRQLDRLTGEQRVHRRDGARGGAAGREAARFYPVSPSNLGGEGDA